MLKEREVIEACKQLDSLAQKTLYEHFLSSACVICRRYITDPDELKDIVQEGFIKVFMNIKTYRYDGSFEGWLKKIFINTSINHLRKSKKFRLNAELNDNISLAENTVADNAEYGSNKIDRKDIDPEKINFDIVASAELTKEELMQALESLPESFRVVFNLFCIEGLGHEEIASMLRIEHATSRSRLNKARALLQKKLYEKSIKKVTAS